MWIAAAAVAYPLFAGVLLAIDAVGGERLAAYLLRYEPRLMWDTFWADYMAALPVMVGIVLTAVALHAAVRRVRPGASSGWAAAVALLAVVGVAGAFSFLPGAAELPLGDVEATASPHVFIIGGGPTPQASEAQIEFNVAWVLRTLGDLVPDAATRVFYANGDGPEPGTVEHLVEAPEETRPFEPLARVFGEEEPNRLRYRAHTIVQAEGATRAETMVPRLESALERLRPGDQAFIVYNGHGTWNEDRADNSLRLWGETRLSVREMEALLSRVDTGVPVRLVLTQCYSGAFERVVHPGARDVLELAEGNRCGFFAESEDRESEGCSASIAVGDYRDYTTYFFAALSGETRLGEPVVARRDWDGDGEVTPFDAHLFTLVNGRNGDLPRSTSEVYLERWQPWALRWTGTRDLPDNLYAEAARQMARANGLPEDNPALGSELERRYDTVVRQLEEASAEALRLRRVERDLQSVIREELVRRWPVLAHPRSASYHEAVSRDLDSISQHIRSHSEYAELVAAQDRSIELALHLVELDRDLSQLEKIKRTRMLARALDQLLRYGAEEHQEDYARLRRCEALPL